MKVTDLCTGPRPNLCNCTEINANLFVDGRAVFISVRYYWIFDRNLHIVNVSVKIDAFKCCQKNVDVVRTYGFVFEPTNKRKHAYLDGENRRDTKSNVVRIVLPDVFISHCR